MFEKLIFIGRAGQDGDLRYTPSGEAVLSFSAACSRKVKDEYRPIWYRVTVWGKLGEYYAEKIKKGGLILVEGLLIADPETGNPRVWTAKDGKQGASFEVRAETVRVLDYSKSDEDKTDAFGSF